MPRKHYDPRPDRQRLDRLGREFAEILDAFSDHDPLVKGRFVVLRRRCGKSPCRCNRGELHETAVFLDRSSGRRKIYSATRQRRRRLETPLRQYRAARRLKVRLRKLYQECRRLCDRLTEHRLALGARVVRNLKE